MSVGKKWMLDDLVSAHLGQHWQSFFKKLSALAIVAVLATLGDKIQIRTFLFVLCRLRQARQAL